MFPKSVVDAALAHAALEVPRESCGLVISVKNKPKYVACTNIASDLNEFSISPGDYAACEDTGTILGVVHSHYGHPPEPSQADLVSCEKTGLPWLIVNQPLGTHKTITPTGYVAPLEGRLFVHGVLDCYSIIKDYYSQELGIDIPEFTRQEEWWLKGDNLYMDNFEQAGFLQVPADSLRKHDVIIMQCRSEVPNHAGIYLGNMVVLQHLAGRLSSKDVYGGYWQRMTVAVVRHRELINNARD